MECTDDRNAKLPEASAAIVLRHRIGILRAAVADMDAYGHIEPAHGIVERIEIRIGDHAAAFDAAHEDANIIFGAVQDEKMKDEVKITVIATGFKSDALPKREKVTAAAAAIAQARQQSSYSPAPPRPAPPPAPPVAVATPTAVAPRATERTQTTIPHRETPSLETVKESVKGNVEQDDLDIPAFLRKRGEHH